MEVHHPHHPTHQKKWTGYLLEFLMLFLAVFLGFTAENIREHRVEQHREKDYIVGILQNLKDDTSTLNRRIPMLENRIRVMDTLMTFGYRELKSQEELKQFYTLAIKLVNFVTFTANTATLAQLKSGNLRLIRRQHAADSILKYDLVNAETARQMVGMLNIYDNYFNESYGIFDLRLYFDSTSSSYGKLVEGTIPPFENRRNYFNKLFGLRVTANGFLQYLKYQQSEALRLIEFLKRVYHIN
jgi:hypothetical protein